MTQLTHLSRITTSSMQLDRVLGDVTAMLCDMIDAKQISIALLERERGVLRLYNTKGQTEVSLNKLPELQALVEATPTFPTLVEPGNEEISTEMSKLLYSVSKLPENIAWAFTVERSAEARSPTGC